MSELEDTIAKGKPKKDSTMVLLESYERQFAKNLTGRDGAPMIHPEKFVRLALTTIRKTPKLAEATVPSLLGALMTCSQLGLEPGGPLGHAYLIPYENRKDGTVEAQLIIGYRGYIDLMYRSDRLAAVAAFAVYQADDFYFELGTNAHLIHRPELDDRGELVAVYAIAELVSGSKPFDVLSKANVDARRQRSRGAASQYSPWNTDYEAMARKTAIRQIFRWLPSSVEFQAAVSADGATFMEIPDRLDDVPDVIDLEPIDEGGDGGS